MKPLCCAIQTKETIHHQSSTYLICICSSQQGGRTIHEYIHKIQNFFRALICESMLATSLLLGLCFGSSSVHKHAIFSTGSICPTCPFSIDLLWIALLGFPKLITCINHCTIPLLLCMLEEFV
ncbi:hypothetical protein MLD38_027900 [Melastoma candidum]|uniref:Uncharacterized protein n=1 Tax=Melastoma candidum TaxID=119954 RepID=A0ACB9MZI3_9MYRT|nr:hypothetical protein MLD38_027900 [Melastoma candidum]